MKIMKKLAILMAAMSVVLTGCQEEEAVVPELLEPVSVGVSTVEVTRQNLFSADIIEAFVVPQTWELTFGMDGELEQMLVKKGDLVTAGQELAVVDQSALQERIDKMEASIIYAETEYGYQLTQADLDIQIAQAKYNRIQEAYNKQEQEKKEAEDAAKKAAENPQALASVQYLLTPQNELALLTGDENSNLDNSSILDDSGSSGGDNSEGSDNSSGDEMSGSDNSGDDFENQDSNDMNSSGSDESSDQNSENSSDTKEDSGKDQENSENSAASDNDQKKPNEITKYDVDRAALEIQAAQLAYTQLEEGHAQAMSQQQQQLDSLKSKLGEDTLTAPCDGRVVGVNFNQGDQVGEFDVVIVLADENVKLIRGGKYSNSSLKAASIDATVDGKTYAIEYVPYDDEEYMKAGMDGEVLPSWFSFTDDSGEVSFGENVSIRVYREYSENTLTLPKNSLKTDDMGYFVYKMEDGQRVKTYVTVGIQTKSAVEILDGLEEGDQVYED